LAVKTECSGWWCGEFFRHLFGSGGERCGVGASGWSLLTGGRGKRRKPCRPRLPAADSGLRRIRRNSSFAKASKHWSNPFSVVRPQAVGLLSDVAANEEQIVKPEAVLKALAQLPVSAWPYGRAVAILVDAKATSSEQDKIAAATQPRDCLRVNCRAHTLPINWIPSSE